MKRKHKIFDGVVVNEISQVGQLRFDSSFIRFRVLNINKGNTLVVRKIEMIESKSPSPNSKTLPEYPP